MTACQHVLKLYIHVYMNKNIGIFIYIKLCIYNIQYGICNIYVCMHCLLFLNVVKISDDLSHQLDLLAEI